MSTNPYSPPAAPLDDTGIPIGPGVGFKSLTPIAKAITMVMAVHVGVELMSDWNTIVAMGVVQRVLADQPYDPAELTAIDVRSKAINVLAYAVAIATVVLFCVFMPRANRNARWFRSPMSITAGWAAGYFFMPIVSLWMPYRAMKEIWQGSDPDPTVEAFTVRVPALLPWWWGLFIAYGVTSQVAQQLNTGIGLSTETFMTRAWIDLGRSLVAIIAILLAIAVVRAVARRQDQRAVRGQAP